MTYDIESFCSAGDKLRELNIKWDRTIVDCWISKNYWGNPDKKYGIHIYFMIGKSDVAYYTPIMKTLFVNDQPRLWGDENLSHTENY